MRGKHFGLPCAPMLRGFRLVPMVDAVVVETSRLWLMRSVRMRRRAVAHGCTRWIVPMCFLLVLLVSVGCRKSGVVPNPASTTVDPNVCNVLLAHTRDGGGGRVEGCGSLRSRRWYGECSQCGDNKQDAARHVLVVSCRMTAAGEESVPGGTRLSRGGDRLLLSRALQQ